MGVMEIDDVVRLKQAEHVVRGVSESLLVDAPLPPAELLAVPGKAMKVVVESFCDDEEVIRLIARPAGAGSERTWVAPLIPLRRRPRAQPPVRLPSRGYFRSREV